MIWLYFIEQGVGGPIKIGLAEDVEGRCEKKRAASVRWRAKNPRSTPKT